MIPAGARVHGVSGQQRIDPRVQRHVAAGLKEPIRRAAERYVLPFAAGTEPQPASDVAVSAKPHTGTVVVLMEKRILATTYPAAGLHAAQPDIHRAVEFNGGMFVASPGRRKRHPAAFASDVRNRGASAVREPISVFELENRHEHQVRARALAHAENRRRFVGAFGDGAVIVQRDRTLIHDDDQRDL